MRLKWRGCSLPAGVEMVMLAAGTKTTQAVDCTSLLSNVALILHQRKVGDFKKRVSLYSVYICEILCIIFL